jgi:hypothetical protein
MCEKNFDGENYPTHVTRLWIDNDEELYSLTVEGVKNIEKSTPDLPEIQKDEIISDIVWDYTEWAISGASLLSLRLSVLNDL